MIALVLTAAFAYQPLSTCGGTPTHWNGPTTWHLTSPGGPMYSRLSDAEVVNAVQAGFDVWRDTVSCCSGFQHGNGGNVSQYYSTNDNTNVISFEEDQWDWSLGSVNGTIAVTFSQWAGGCVLTDGDQIYNGVGFDFTTSSNPGWGDTDLQSIAAHENGHWLGLGHASSGSSTMYYAYPGGTSARSLATDDENGVCNAYPGVCGPREDDCSDGLDDDSDGQVDCADADCAGYGSCVCAPITALSCNVPMTGSNQGRSNDVESYSCMDWTTNGPEAVYEITPSVTGPVTIDLTGLSDDLDLFVTGGSNGNCESGTCQGASGSPDSEPESLTFQGVAGTTYMVVADGWNGATSSFTLTATCAEAPPPPAPGPQSDPTTSTDDPVSGDPLEPGDTGAPAAPGAYVQMGSGCACSTDGPGETGGLAAVRALFGRR
ncbi:MAG: matrixin family metalloprotease [Myxococcota bacterium]